VSGAVDALTGCLAVERAPIRVNVISLGFVDTEMWNDMPVQQKDTVLKDAAKKVLVGHIADADEVAEAYLFAMKCNYLTGQTIHIEGGYLLL